MVRGGGSRRRLRADAAVGNCMNRWLVDASEPFAAGERGDAAGRLRAGIVGSRAFPDPLMVIPDVGFAQLTLWGDGGGSRNVLAEGAGSAKADLGVGDGEVITTSRRRRTWN